MTIFARVENGRVMELVTPLEGFTIQESYHPDISGQFVDVTNIDPRPQHYWVYDGSKFSEPPETPKRKPIIDERYAALEKRIVELEKLIAAGKT